MYAILKSSNDLCQRFYDYQRRFMAWPILTKIPFKILIKYLIDHSKLLKTIFSQVSDYYEALILLYEKWSKNSFDKQNLTLYNIKSAGQPEQKPGTKPKFKFKPRADLQVGASNWNLNKILKTHPQPLWISVWVSTSGLKSRL